MMEYKSFLGHDMHVFLAKKKNEVQTQGGINNIANHLLSFDRYLAANGHETINEKIVTGWVGSLCPLSDGTINNYICDVQAFLIFENAWRKAGHFVPQYIREEDSYIPHIFTALEKKKFYVAIDNYEPGKANKLPWIKAELPMVIRICDGCGTRITETLELKMENVNLTTGVLKIIKAKNNRQRYVPMSTELTDILRKYCIAMGIANNPGAWLFPRKTRDMHLTEECIGPKFRIILRDLGIIDEDKYGYRERRPCVHNLRATFAVNALRSLWKSCIDIDDRFSILSVYLGHESLKETEKYLKFCVEFFPEELDKFDVFVDGMFGEDPWEKYGL